MANLFWKRSRNVKALLATQFRTEEEFERTVFDTPEILEDIFLLESTEFFSILTPRPHSPENQPPLRYPP